MPSTIIKEIEPEVAALGEEVLSQRIFDYVTDAEKNLPYLRGSGRDSFAKRTSDSLIVAEGWRELQNFGIEKGIVAYNYDRDIAQYTRIVQFLRLHLWESSAANTPCPVAMTDGAARLLQMHLAKNDLDPTQRDVLQKAFDRLISRDPKRAWTSGQWMTERPGGSDVSLTETVATYAPDLDKTSASMIADLEEKVPLGPWSIDGFKFFSSATDSSMTILLAKTTPDQGVSAFFAPMRRHNPALVSVTGNTGGSELNGVHIQRLKDKFGTKSLPTAELELSGMRGWLIGGEGKGIQEISTILNITRAHSTIAAMGYLGRGLAVAKAYAFVREVGAGKGKRIPLCKSPLHMRTLSDMASEYHALMLLTFFTIYVMGIEETLKDGRKTLPPSTDALTNLTPPPEHVAPLLRVLSSLHKAYCCKQSVPLMYACMESLGGVGYMNNAESEHLNLSRLFRDLCVLSIWEGTTDVLSTDTLRALKHPSTGKQSLDAVDWFVSSAFGSNHLWGSQNSVVLETWKQLRSRLETESPASLAADARDITFRIAEVLIGALLSVDARSDGNLLAAEMSRRFLERTGLSVPVSASTKTTSLTIDSAIVYGDSGVSPSNATSKL